MNNKDSEDAPKTADKSFLLAETVAAGLHALAQPLTAVQWNLEILALDAGAETTHTRESAAALTSIENAIAKLDFLREIIRPFRRRTEFVAESFFQTLVHAHEEQQEILSREGLELVLSGAGNDREVMAPRGFLPRLAFLLINLIRSLNPQMATIQAQSEVEMTSVEITLRNLPELKNPAKSSEEIFCVRAYVEVLDGHFEMTPDASHIKISFPVASASSKAEA